jgi:hypothetical protein
MKNETTVAKRKRELTNIEAIGITPEQLQAIRKLNGRNCITGNTYRATLINETFSNRTIEAVLQGRRFNAEITHAAIYAAKEQLQRLTKVMNEVEGILNSRQTQ